MMMSKANVLLVIIFSFLQNQSSTIMSSCTACHFFFVLAKLQQNDDEQLHCLSLVFRSYKTRIKQCQFLIISSNKTTLICNHFSFLQNHTRIRMSSTTIHCCFLMSIKPHQNDDKQCNYSSSFCYGLIGKKNDDEQLHCLLSFFHSCKTTT